MSKKPASRPNVKTLKGASSEHAYRELMQEIVSFSLMPGEDLDEATLVGRLGLRRKASCSSFRTEAPGWPRWAGTTSASISRHSTCRNASSRDGQRFAAP